MTRDEAIQWCVKHVEEWPEGFTPSFAPDGWSWRVCNGNGHIGLIKHGGVRFISRNTWMRAKGIISIPFTIKVINPDTTPCGQSFHDLMKEIQRC